MDTNPAPVPLYDRITLKGESTQYIELKRNMESLDKGVGLKKKLKKSPGRSKSIMKGASSPLNNEKN